MSKFADYLDSLFASIEEAENPAQTLENLLKGPAYERTIELMEEEDAEDDWPGNDYARVKPALSGLVNYFTALDLDERAFYERFWNEISREYANSTEQSKRAVILFLLGCPLLPYCQIDLLTMESDEVGQRLEKLSESLHTLAVIENREFALSFQKAAAILDVIDPQNDRADRALLLAFALDNDDE